MELFLVQKSLQADAVPYASASNAMHSFVDPIVGTMCLLASLVCVFFLFTGGYYYMTSSGKPENLQHAKLVIRNALIGLAIVLAAVTMTTILSHAYGEPHSGSVQQMPTLSSIQPQPAGSGLVDILIKAITGLLRNIIESIASPFMKALGYFTSGTPLMASNGSIFKLWLTVLGITDTLFVLVVVLLGFHVMSFASFGLEEIEFRHLLPQIALIFLLFNVSIFAIDGIIELSNAMIHALNAAFPSASVWHTLSSIAGESGSLGVAGLLIMTIFLIFSVILLVYYVGRLITLYLGAILSPLLVLLWLVPGFKDFVETAIKVYLATIFVLFIHVVILQLAASIFSGLTTASNSDQAPDPLMALLVGLAAIIALLKTQGVLMQFSYASIGPRTARKLGGQFVNAVSAISPKDRRAVPHNSPTSGSSRPITMGRMQSSSKVKAQPGSENRPKRWATASHWSTRRNEPVFSTNKNPSQLESIPRRVPNQKIIVKPVKTKSRKGILA